jgi:hypothetical protein
MFRTYYRARMYIALAVAAVVLTAIAGKEWAWASSYVEVPANVVAFEQSCAGGSRGPGFIDCSEAFSGADRRTLLTLRYTSPADGQSHDALIRCDTAATETPSYATGQQLLVLAHRTEPERVDRRKCTTVTGEG